MNENHRLPPERAAQDMDRVIAHYGRPPADEVKQTLRESLAREKERFVSLERTKSRTLSKGQEFDRDF